MLSAGIWGGWASIATQAVKNLPAVWETWVWSLDQEDPLEKEMENHSIILAWKIPRTEELGGLYYSTRDHKSRHNLATKPPPNSGLTSFYVSITMIL